MCIQFPNVIKHNSLGAELKTTFNGALTCTLHMSREMIKSRESRSG